MTASLKPLKSVAHNLPHWFASTLNYWGDDYAIGHLARAVDSFPDKRVEIDVLAQTSVPPLSGLAQQIVAPLRDKLSELLRKEGFEPGLLASATLVYTFSHVDVRGGTPRYECVCTLGTTSGRTYSVSLTEANTP